MSVGGIGAIGVFRGFGGSAVPAGLGSSGRASRFAFVCWTEAESFGVGPGSHATVSAFRKIEGSAVRLGRVGRYAFGVPKNLGIGGAVGTGPTGRFRDGRDDFDVPKNLEIGGSTAADGTVKSAHTAENEPTI